jgi:hypothetical protein
LRLRPVFHPGPYPYANSRAVQPMQHSNASAVCAKIQGSPSWHECPCGAFVLTRQGQLAHVGPLTVSCLIYLVQIHAHTGRRCRYGRVCSTRRYIIDQSQLSWLLYHPGGWRLKRGGFRLSRSRARADGLISFWLSFMGLTGPLLLLVAGCHSMGGPGSCFARLSRECERLS